MEKIVNSDSDEAILQELQPATTYTIEVIAENRVGRSSPSATIRHSTLEEPPTSFPHNISVSHSKSLIDIIKTWIFYSIVYKINPAC